MSQPKSKKPRLLTKSRFKLAFECPTKLAYTGKPEYGNNKDGDPFLKALAEGGFQVGALAKLYFPDGIEVESLDYENSLAATKELLSKDKVTIYEPAIRFGNLLVRIDILKKDGNKIELYEVKAKSFDAEEDYFFYKRGKEQKLIASWEPYLYDIAFQDYVTRKAFPEFTVKSFLYLVNKREATSVEELNQNFLLKKLPNGRSSVSTKKALSLSELGTPILTPVNVEKEVSFIQNQKYGALTFEKWVSHLAESYEQDVKIQPELGKGCKQCEFRIGGEEKSQNLKSGFDECWKPALKSRLDDPLVFDLWNYRGTEKCIEQKKYFLNELTQEDINVEPRKEGEGLSQKERQWLQVEKEKKADKAPYFDLHNLGREIASWKYPLHFIDFETTATAIPFNKGKRPYEQIAFQFSHHIAHKDGRIEHAGEYINTERGKFPNFEFIKALKAQLDKDLGTIFRYAAHENSILCRIYDQLESSDLPKSEVAELCEFIRTITKRKNPEGKEVLWEGSRNMVDMRELVLRYYYHPFTKGSNSLKYVLPATLNGSTFLKEKYSKPIYGAGNIVSKNYRNKQWIHYGENGMVLDPYKTLEPIFSPEEDRKIESMCPETEIADGGAAMMAYARMQFTEMSEEEVKQVSQALLRYCELDTFAMVMLFEYWKDAVETKKFRKEAA